MAKNWISALEYTPGDRLVDAESERRAARGDDRARAGRLRARPRAARRTRCGVLPALSRRCAQHMIEKMPPDLSRFLLCPMPGLLVRLDVAAATRSRPGQPLAVVEAMKMENILRAEKAGSGQGGQRGGGRKPGGGRGDPGAGIAGKREAEQSLRSCYNWRHKSDCRGAVCSSGITPMDRKFPLALMLAASTALAGCAVGPDYRPAPQPSWACPMAIRSSADAAAPADMTAWWASFDDPMLGQLVEQARTRQSRYRAGRRPAAAGARGAGAGARGSAADRSADRPVITGRSTWSAGRARSRCPMAR